MGVGKMFRVPFLVSSRRCGQEIVLGGRWHNACKSEKAGAVMYGKCKLIKPRRLATEVAHRSHESCCLRWRCRCRCHQGQYHADPPASTHVANSRLPSNYIIRRGFDADKHPYFLLVRLMLPLLSVVIHSLFFHVFRGNSRQFNRRNRRRCAVFGPKSDFVCCSTNSSG